jgi:hypothetical protein
MTMIESLIISLMPWKWVFLAVFWILIGYTVIGALTFVLWLAYKRVMALQAWRDRKNRTKKEMAVVLLRWGWLLLLGPIADVLHRYLFAWTIIWGYGRLSDYTVTAMLHYFREEMKGDSRLKRIQRRRATYICENWLNPHDPSGKHC